MKAETLLKPTLCHFGFSLTYNRYEHGHQLVGLVCQSFQLVSPAQSCSIFHARRRRFLPRFLGMLEMSKSTGSVSSGTSPGDRLRRGSNGALPPLAPQSRPPSASLVAASRLPPAHPSL